jgi:hypothetical protein
MPGFMPGIDKPGHDATESLRVDVMCMRVAQKIRAGDADPIGVLGD